MCVLDCHFQHIMRYAGKLRCEIERLNGRFASLRVHPPPSPSVSHSLLL